MLLSFTVVSLQHSTSEMEDTYYHHKVNVRVAEQDAEQFKGSLEMRKVNKTFDY